MANGAVSKTVVRPTACGSSSLPLSAKPWIPVGTIRVRRYRPSDFESVMAVERASFPEKIAFSRTKMRRRLSAGVGFVAVATGPVTGYVICAERRRRGRIVSIAVHPSVRGLGLGGRLMQRAIGGMKKRGVLVYSLYVQTSAESAIALYRQLGFRIVRTIRGHYADGSDALLMKKII